MRGLAAQAIECLGRWQRFAPAGALTPWMAPTAIAIVALALRMHGLADKPLWLDEVASLRRATMPLPDVVAESLHSSHYPAYFLLLWLVAKAGATPWLLRLPSAIFGAINAGLVCAIGRDADGLRTGIAAGLLLALSPFDVQYGQEARSYTLAACLILVAMWGLLRLVSEPADPRSHRLGPVPVPRLAWVAYCAGTAAALNVLNVAIPWFVAANLAALVIACRRRAGTERRSFLLSWSAAQIVILAAWLPSVVAVYIATAGSVLHAAGWAPPETLATVWSIVAPVYLHRIAAFITFDVMPARVPGLSIVIAVLAAYGAWRLRRFPAVLAAIGCAAIVVPLLLLFPVSLLTPVMVPRYFAWSAAPFFLLAGAALGRLSLARFAACATALAAACLANLLPYYHDETKPRWDLAAARLVDAAREGDVVLLNSGYAQYVLTASADLAGLDDRELLMTWHPNEAAARLAPHHDLWVVFGRAGQVSMETPDDYVNSLSWLGRPISEDHIGRYIVMWHFAPSALAADCRMAPDCPEANPANAKP